MWRKEMQARCLRSLFIFYAREEYGGEGEGLGQWNGEPDALGAEPEAGASRS